VDLYFVIGIGVAAIFAFDLGHRWWRESEWKRRRKRRDH
jgi:hypothetical protein